MRIEGGDKLRRQLRALKGTARKHVVKAIRTGTEEGARIAKVLAPDVTGETRDRITTEYKDEGMHGEVVVIATNTPRHIKDKYYSIEHGRKEGDHGTTEGVHFVHRTRSYLAKKNRNRMRRALRLAVKEAAGRG